MAFTVFEQKFLVNCQTIFDIVVKNAFGWPSVTVRKKNFRENFSAVLLFFTDSEPLSFGVWDRKFMLCCQNHFARPEKQFGK